MPGVAIARQREGLQVPAVEIQQVREWVPSRQSRTLSDAGRVFFAISREKKSTANDADRLRKYLARFGLTWDAIHAS